MFGCVTSGLNRGSSYCSSIHSCALCTELAVKTRLWPGECSASFATVLFGSRLLNHHCHLATCVAHRSVGSRRRRWHSSRLAKSCRTRCTYRNFRTRPCSFFQKKTPTDLGPMGRLTRSVSALPVSTWRYDDREFSHGLSPSEGAGRTGDVSSTAETPLRLRPRGRGLTTASSYSRRAPPSQVSVAPAAVHATQICPM